MSESPAETTPARPPRAWIWPAIVIALLAGQALLLGVVVLVATNDPTFAVEPDYYQRGVHWDAAAAQRRTDAALGWSVAIALGDHLGALGERSVDLTLRNREGTPLDGAQINVVAFAHARANERLSLDLAPVGGGRYTATTRFARKGVWEFRVTVHRGPETFDYVETRDVYPPGESRPWRP